MYARVYICSLNCTYHSPTRAHTHTRISIIAMLWPLNEICSIRSLRRKHQGTGTELDDGVGRMMRKCMHTWHL